MWTAAIYHWALWNSFFLHLQWRKIFLFSLLPSGEASLHQNVNIFPADIVSKL
jgi:hypothetical protein